MAEEEGREGRQPWVSDPGGVSERARGSSEGPRVVSQPLEPERPDVLGWSGLDGQAALDHRVRVGRSQATPPQVGVARGESGTPWTTPVGQPLRLAGAGAGPHRPARRSTWVCSCFWCAGSP